MSDLLGPVVYVVDDEVAVQAGLDSLLRSVGYHVKCFSSADDFLTATCTPAPSCLLLDVRMPEKSGFDLQDALRNRLDGIPIIFLTGHGDVPMSVRAMRGGALNFILKPFHEQKLLDAVREAISMDQARRAELASMSQFQDLFRTLSPREKEILTFVAEGETNKDIAARLSLKEITIKVHRAAGMRKLHCRGVAELVAKLKRQDLRPGPLRSSDVGI